MDIGKFKASRTRLIMWILVPPMLILGTGLSTYGLKLKSEWDLNRTRGLSEVLPKLVQTQGQAQNLIKEFQGSDNDSIKSEDELISYLQGSARKVGFTVDSLKVDRRAPLKKSGAPVLTASVKGSGAFEEIQNFIGDVTTTKRLLSESTVQVTRPTRSYNSDTCNASITFELVLFELKDSNGGLL